MSSSLSVEIKYCRLQIKLLQIYEYFCWFLNVYKRNFDMAEITSIYDTISKIKILHIYEYFLLISQKQWCDGVHKHFPHYIQNNSDDENIVHLQVFLPWNYIFVRQLFVLLNVSFFFFLFVNNYSNIAYYNALLYVTSVN